MFILSTPDHGYAKNLVMAILDKWDNHFNIFEDGWHIKFFSPRTLCRLIEDEGFVDTCFRFGGRVPFLMEINGLPLPETLTHYRSSPKKS